MPTPRNFAIAITGAHREDNDTEFNKLFEGLLVALEHIGYTLVSATADWDFAEIEEVQYLERKAQSPNVKLLYQDKGLREVAEGPKPEPIPEKQPVAPQATVPPTTPDNSVAHKIGRKFKKNKGKKR